jgi:hypothetical protein
VIYEQFIGKLENAGIEYTLFRYYTASYVEVGRFAYAFDGRGKCTGGWIMNCADDWRSEWQEWMDMLTEPI